MILDNVSNLLKQQANQNTKDSTLSTKMQNEDQNTISNKSDEPLSLDLEQFKNNDISNGQILYTTEDALTSTELFTKNILDNLMSQIFTNNEELAMFPPSLSNIADEMFQNPYDLAKDAGATTGMMVGVHQEYYQKQTFDFSASVTIQTPTQTYQMDISISITQELYISQDTMFNFDEENPFEPINLFHDKDENPFEGIDHLSFIFDQNEDDRKTLQDWMEEMLNLFDSYDKEKEDENTNNLINVYQETYESKYQLASIIDTDQGKAVYLSSSETYYRSEQLSYQSSSLDSKEEESLDLIV